MIIVLIGLAAFTLLGMHQELGLRQTGSAVEYRIGEIPETMQHGSAAVTVTPENCADAILDVRRVIDRLWQNTFERNLTLPYKAILRIVELYASSGNRTLRQAFEDAMRQARWGGVADDRKARVHEVIVEAGLRANWYLAIHQAPEVVEQIIVSL